MDVRIISVAIVFVVVLLLAPTLSSIDAAHVPKYKDARKEFKEKSEEIEKEKTAKYEEIRKAWIAYKIAHKDWKSVKAAYKTAKISGDQTTIDAKKVILDKAVIDRDLAMKKYFNLKKSK